MLHVDFPRLHMRIQVEGHSVIDYQAQRHAHVFPGADRKNPAACARTNAQVRWRLLADINDSNAADLLKAETHDDENTNEIFMIWARAPVLPSGC